MRFDVHAARADNGERVGELLSRRTVFAGLLVVIAVYYLFLLSNGTFALEAYAFVSGSAISGGTASKYGLEQISNIGRFGRLP